MWQAAAGISFREAESPERADILIGAQAEPEGWAFADVFYDMKSPVPVKPISRALICLNPTRQWKVGFDGDLQRYDLRYTFAHEIGHAIGLDHPAGAGQIMGYRYEERFRELQAGDVSGAVLLYGRRQPETVIAATLPSPHVRRMSPARLYAKRWGSRAFTAPAP
jgi:Matrixin